MAEILKGLTYAGTENNILILIYEMGKACGAHREYEYCVQNFGWRA
jgi:hypothetical protein